MRRAAFALACTVPVLGGCVVKTAYNVATLPVRAGSKVVDWTTTSQDEADRNAGRRMRHEAKRDERERRAWQKRCGKHPERADCRASPGDDAGHRG